jgi:hypothetical protein
VGSEAAKVHSAVDGTRPQEELSQFADLFGSYGRYRMNDTDGVYWFPLVTARLHTD